MKLKAITLALFVAGIASSYALADNGGGKGHGKKAAAAATTTAATTTSGSSNGKAKGKAKQAEKKVTICHKAGKSGKFVKISVAKQAVKAHKRHGDVEAVDGNCPSTPPTTTETTTTSTTTTSTTTTSTQ